MNSVCIENVFRNTITIDRSAEQRFQHKNSFVGILVRFILTLLLKVKKSGANTITTRLSHLSVGVYELTTGNSGPGKANVDQGF